MGGFLISLKAVTFSVRLYQRRLPLLAGTGIPMLHAQHPSIPLLVNMPEDILIIHLSRRRFIPPRVIADLEIPDFTIGQVDVLNDIPLVPLHVIHIEKDLTGRTVHGPADGIGLV